MPFTNYLVYWKRDGFDHKNGDLLKFAAGAQLKKIKPQDRLYIISWTKETGFIFVGRIIVERIVGLKDAQVIMNRPNLGWDTLYAIAGSDGTSSSPTPTVLSPIDNLLSKVWIETDKKAVILKPPFKPAQFQSFRILSPYSTSLFDNLLNSQPT
jgi:hypothetical protein